MIKNCNTCALRDKRLKLCPVFKIEMSDEKSCPYHTFETNPCDICGSHIPSGAILIEEEREWYRLCGTCASQPDCYLCANQYCAFQSDSSCGIPAYTMRTVQQGNAVIQTQIPNPARKEVLCPTCPCYNPEDKSCKREIGARCEKFKLNRRNA